MKDIAPPQQASMFDAFAQAETERATAHMPGRREDAGPYLASLIALYNSAILAGDQAAKDRIRGDADLLAAKLNGGSTFGMKARGEICDYLDELVRAPDGVVPGWGQCGSFTINVQGCAIRIEFEGFYGLCELAFSAHAVDWDKPFISETGYRSFLMGEMDCTGGGQPVEDVVRGLVERHIAGELRGKLVSIHQTHRDINDERAEDEPEP